MPYRTMTTYDTAYVGTFTDGEGSGIYRCRTERETGAIEQVGTTEAGENPGFLALHPAGDALYAANEVDPGTVTAFEIDGSGDLSLQNVVESGGTGPAHVSVDATGSMLLVSDYHGGVLSVLPLGDDGRVEEPSQIIDHGSGANVHTAVPGPENEVAYVTALGNDDLLVYDMDVEACTLAEKQRLSLPSGSGPRHVDVHPDGAVLYVLCEQQSTLFAFERNADGTLSETARIDTLPPEATADNYPAEVQVHDSGRYLFVSNRGYDSIATFELAEPARPKLTGQTDSGGSWPRHFAVSPDGSVLYAANQKSDDIHAFRIGNEGTLEATGTTIEIPQPVCVLFAH